MKLCLALILITLGTLSSYGQEIFRHSYNVKQGAPSNEYYGVKEDKNGYLWFVSDNGVTKYNGLKFTNYDLSKTELENSIIDIYRSEEGIIWFISYNGLLAYTEGDSIVPFERNKELKKLLTNKNILSSFNISSSGNIYYGIRNHGLITITKDSLSLSVSDETFENGNQYHSKLHIDNIEGELCFHYGTCKSNQDRYKKGSSTILPLYIYINGEKINLPTTTMGGSFFNHIKLSEDKWLCSYQRVLFEFDQGNFTPLHTLDHEILDLLYLDSTLYVACNNGGGIKKYDPKNNKVIASYLEGLSISGITSNFAHEIWCTSLENGLYRCSNINVNSLLPENTISDKITDFTVCNDSIFVLYSSGEVQSIHNNITKPYAQVESDLKMLWIDNIDGQLYTGNHTFKGEAYLLNKAKVTPVFLNRKNIQLM